MISTIVHWQAGTRALLCAGTALCGAVIYATPVLAQSGESAQLEEVVVTAQKRQQNLQDVPISVTALGTTALQANRVLDVRDLNAVAPNLSVRIAPGGTSQANFSMRGLVTAGAALGSDKGISVYIDGVYVQSAKGSFFQLADVERIEVLKGPQGTLFGRNATAGAISIVTRNPTGEFGVRQELSYGNYNQFRSKTRVDFPQFGPISASISYVHSERNGDTRNLGAGTAWNYDVIGMGVRRSPKRLGDENNESLFGAIRFDLIDGLDLVYKGDWTKSHFTPEAQGMGFIDSRLISSVILGSQPNQALMTPVTNQRPSAVNNAFSTPSKFYNYGHNLTAQYAVNDNLSVKNVLSFRQSGVNSTYELDGVGGLVVTPGIVAAGLAAPATLGQPWVLLVSNGFQKERQWSDEFQINYQSKLVDVTAGYIHFDYHVRGGGFAGVAVSTSFRALPGFAIPPRGFRNTIVDVKSDAVFLQAEGHVTTKLDLVGGYRWTQDRKTGIDNGLQDAAGNSLGAVIDYKKSRPTYLVGINYRPSDDVLLYAKYATGFISGGQLAGINYTPETARSYEAGVKADLFDRRVRSNLAVFDVKYEGLQFQTNGTNLLPPVNASPVLVNAGAGKAHGFEWENTFLPIDGLTITANVGYTDFKYTRIEPLIGNLTTFLPTNRPKWSLVGSVQYDTADIVAGGHLSFRLDANYRSKTYLGFSAAGNQAAVDALTTKNSWIVNSRVALVDFDLAGKKAEVALWGRNLFNNDDLATGSTLTLGALGTIFAGSYERARTYGVDLRVDF